jgi:hypothetical protein
MDAKSRGILAVLMSAMMVCMVTLLATFINLGLPADFLLRWGKAFIFSWPVAAATAFLVMPVAERTTRRIVTAIAGST